MLCLSGPHKVVVKEDTDAILPCLSSPKQNLERDIFDWKKDGQKEVFFYDAGSHYNNGRRGQDAQFEGRVFHFPEELRHGNASIMIRNAKMEDAGNYTCFFPRLQADIESLRVELIVGKRADPTSIVFDGSGGDSPFSFSFSFLLAFFGDR
uniref:Ig-like domain-containing protein n=1 Tax=Mola mola TaxID=94237 RepID=A0A3Q3XIM4_MOLML